MNLTESWSKITERFGGGKSPDLNRYLSPSRVGYAGKGSRRVSDTCRGHSSLGIIASAFRLVYPSRTATKKPVSGPMNPGYAGVVNPTNRRGQAQEGLQGWRLETLPRMILRSRYSLGIKRLAPAWSSFDLDFLARFTRGQTCGFTRLAKQRSLDRLGDSQERDKETPYTIGYKTPMETFTAI